MLFLKPFIKTIILAAILFFLLIYLGMKYHWVETFQNKVNKIELNIPAQSAVIGEFDNVKLDEGSPKDFQPILIQGQEQGASALLADMTKGQIAEQCQKLFRKTAMDKDLRELAVGDCVVSIYRKKTILSSIQNRQDQVKRKNATQQCQRTINHTKFSNEIERQLLVGICVSDKLNR
ncbi:MAG TPA: hypothetical protein EYH38_01205 [Leucothrix sp.]|nr:hypothetical protein [Leucothrix sp.]